MMCKPVGWNRFNTKNTPRYSKTLCFHKLCPTSYNCALIPTISRNKKEGRLRGKNPNTNGHWNMTRSGILQSHPGEQSRTKAQTQTPQFSRHNTNYRKDLMCCCWQTKHSEVLLQTVKIHSGSIFTRSVSVNISSHKPRYKLKCKVRQWVPIGLLHLFNPLGHFWTQLVFEIQSSQSSV